MCPSSSLTLERGGPCRRAGGSRGRRELQQIRSLRLDNMVVGLAALLASLLRGRSDPRLQQAAPSDWQQHELDHVGRLLRQSMIGEAVSER